MTDSWYFEVLPLRPSVNTDECLSSYLIRLAHANGYTHFWGLVSDLFPMWSKRHQVNLLRWEYPVDGWGRIPARTHLTPVHLRRLTVAPWIEKFRPPLILTRGNRLSPGHYLQGVVNPNIKVCPLCLRSRAYIRLMWRLGPVDTCLQHGCLLQSQCRQCGSPLSGIESQAHHWRCTECDTDWRMLPVEIAAAQHLEAQERSQAALRFLLNPDVSLVKLPNPDSNEKAYDLAQAIGLKFRYLRIEEGYSVTEMAQRVGVYSGMISALEHGEHPPLLSYLAYLETLSLSWPEFAALEVPPAFVQEIQQPSFMAIRQCPAPTCRNHHPPPSLRVQLLADLPHQQKLRFRCLDCGLYFTLTYEGARVTKPCKPALQPNEPHLITKSAEEVNRLIEMGQQGMSNRQIAHCLGWGEKTIRIYWIALGMKDEIHQAQAEQRTQEQQQRYAVRRARIEAVLRRLLQEDEEITLRRVGRELGRNSDYLHAYPDLAEEVSEQIHSHNIEVRQRRYERLAAQTTQFADAIRSGNDDLTFGEIAQQMGLPTENLRKLFPELHTLIREALDDRRVRLKTLRTQRECAQINEAAARLVAIGSRLNYAAILREAGLSVYRGQCDPVIHDLLQQWVGGFAPRA